MLQLGIRGLGIARFKFNPISWFLKGEPGAWYDPSDLTTLFQDSAGTIPVTAVEQPVGLMLDKSRGLALGAELVTNGDFSNGSTGWTLGAGVVISNGEFISTASSSNNIATTTGTFYANNTYLITLTVSQYTSGVMNFRVGVSVNAGTLTPTGIGKYSIYVRPTGDGTAFSIATGALTATLDNISVKQIAGNHAFQGDSTSTPAKRPMLSARVNLLTKTEDFSDGYWIKGSCTVAPTKYIAPNGLLSANKIQVTSSGQAYVLNVAGNTASGLTGMKISLSVANAGFNFAYVQINETGGTTKASVARINLTTGETNTAIVAGGGLASFVPIAKQQDNGFWLLSITWVTDSASSAIQPYLGPCDSLAVSTSTISGTNGIYIWGADLRPTNSGALLPAYQRVNTASDYDTIGFPLYLKANGTSSAMSTNSIDFSSTDKMTVVTGVRKLSDASFRSILELSSAFTANNGSFAFWAYGAAITDYYYGIRGTVTNAISVIGYAAPVSNVVACQNSISTPISDIRINGYQAGTNATTQGTGTYGNYPLYLFARAGTSQYFNGQFYGAIIRGAASDTASVTQTENYMAQKTGITF